MLGWSHCLTPGVSLFPSERHCGFYAVSFKKAEVAADGMGPPEFLGSTQICLCCPYGIKKNTQGMGSEKALVFSHLSFPMRSGTPYLEVPHCSPGVSSMFLPHTSCAVEKLNPLSVWCRQKPGVERKKEGQEGRWIHSEPASVSQARVAGTCMAWTRWITLGSGSGTHALQYSCLCKGIASIDFFRLIGAMGKPGTSQDQALRPPEALRNLNIIFVAALNLTGLGLGEARR